MNDNVKRIAVANGPNIFQMLLVVKNEGVVMVTSDVHLKSYSILCVYTSRSFVDYNLFHMGCFVVERCLPSRGPSAIAELLVTLATLYQHGY